MEVSGQLHATADLLQGKGLLYLVDSRWGGLQRRCGQGGEEKESLHCPCRDSNKDHPAHSLVTILTNTPTLKII